MTNHDSRVTIVPPASAPRTALYVLAVAAALCSGLTASIAQVQGASAITNFRAIDTDGDAKLNRAELTAAADRDFARLDVDHDGYLTRGELTRTGSKTLLLPFPGRFSSQAAFSAADTDHDRKIDRHEYESAVVGSYMRCDRNHDNTIELSDLRRCGR